jgi:hypothetical protein
MGRGWHVTFFRDSNNTLNSDQAARRTIIRAAEEGDNVHHNTA